MDVLAAKGSVEVLSYLRLKKKAIKIPTINHYFNSEQSKTRLTTATIYRRVKELELLGMLTKNNEGEVSITEYGKKCLLEIQGEEIRLKKSRRDILNVIQAEEEINVQKIQDYGYSPVTIQRSVQDLEELDLVEKNRNEGSKRKQKKVGRPKKLIKLTEKGKKYIEKQEKLEKNQKNK